MPEEFAYTAVQSLTRVIEYGQQATEGAAAAAAAAGRAEGYAKEKHPDSAQRGAEQTERGEANKQVSTGAGTGVDRVAYVAYVVDKVTEAEPAKQLNQCDYVSQGCTVTYGLHLDATVSTGPALTRAWARCPAPCRPRTAG
ncbi:hypothetical protein ACIQU6_39215 [Streptomyces sp. NPDC090442]|uniref:hypothetical protein n=1 Tax=Streptomyces sp. NPDC090442 TaxID=3365962 RepID=UPI0037FBA98B